MFDLLARLLCSITSFAFPVFASYKALKANDPSQLVPWLMYWIVIACVLTVESWIGWVLCWFPFYQEIRAGFLLWLVLPQTQGATKLYLEYIHPTLTKHERDIEDFLARTSDQVKAIGFQYVKRLADMIKEALFGTLQQAQAAAQQHPPSPSPSPGDSSTYVEALFSRWKVPPLGPFAPQMASDLYTFLSSALQQQQTGAEGQHIFPAHVTTRVEKARFIALQKERLSTVLAALDKEQAIIGEFPDDGAVASGADTLLRSPSQGNLSAPGGDFDHVSMEDAAATAQKRKNNAGGWLWGWGGPAGAGEAGKPHAE